MASVSLERVSKHFGSDIAVRDLTLTVPHGEFLVILGPSGCGKSTLLRMLAGLVAPTSGRIRISDRDVSDVPARDRDIAFVFQSYALYPHMTVRRNLAFPLLMRDFKWWQHIPGVGAVVKRRRERLPQVQQTVADAAAALSLEGLLDRKPATLSGGQRQRVALGRAMVRNPQVFLMDEPLSNLDANLRVQMRTELSKLHRHVATTIIYVTHDQTEALSLGTSVLVMNKGEVQQFGRPRDVLERPRNTFVAKFMGQPPMNLLPVEWASRDQLMVGGVALPLPSRLLELMDRSGEDPGGLLLGVRPDHVELAPVDEPGVLRGRVVGLESTGLDTIIGVELEAARPAAQQPEPPPAYAGDSVVYLRVPEYVVIGAEEEVGLRLNLANAMLFDRTTGLRLLDPAEVPLVMA